MGLAAQDKGIWLSNRELRIVGKNAPVFALSATMVAARPDELVTAERALS
jgi:hypothetical protein